MNYQLLFQKFVHLYPISKTLRFELIPQGATQKFITEKQVLLQDEVRARKYPEMKQAIDGYHKDFIQRALGNIDSQSFEQALQTFQELFLRSQAERSTEAYKKEFETTQTKLRELIVNSFEKGEFKQEYKSLFDKNLITNLLKPWVEKQSQTGDNNYTYHNDFNKFTTYFLGFHDNRKNIYSKEPHKTALAYRLIHENLPKFLENNKILRKIQNDHPALWEQLQALHHTMPQLFNGWDLSQLLQVSFFSNTLTQTGIDQYNTIIGGISEGENRQKIQGINELINLYNQKQDKKNRVAKLKQLYKQILSDRSTLSFLPQQFADDAELYHAINMFYLDHLHYQSMVNGHSYTLLERVQLLINELANYDLSKVYLAPNQLSAVSHQMFGDFGYISRALSYYYMQVIQPDYELLLASAKTTAKIEAIEKLKTAFLDAPHSLVVIQAAIDKYLQLQPSSKPHTQLTDFIISLLKQYETVADDQSIKIINIFSDIKGKYSCIKGLVNTESTSESKREILQNEKLATDIKAFMDAINNVIKLLKPFALNEKLAASVEKDARFYSDFEEIYQALLVFVPLYNKVRNYITQKPYSTEKFKLNFNKPTLLSGWDANKEADNLSILLRKNGNYYLAIMDTAKGANKAFEPKALNQLKVDDTTDCYEKMVYKLLPGPNKMFPKVFFSESRKAQFNPPQHIIESYNKKEHISSEAHFDLKKCHALIDWFKQCIELHEDWKHFNFKFSPTSQYSNISDFYKEVSEQNYKVHFQDIPADYIEQLVAEGKLYLFQIYNKDFSPHAKGKENLHTMYFKALFSEENLKQPVFKLSGEAEMFYRPASLQLENTTIHKAGEAMVAKNPLTPHATRTLAYDIIKDRRFTTDKYLLHIPISLNFHAQESMSIKKHNDLVRQMIKHNHQDLHIIGIDRGEKHLLYVSVIDLKGNIVYQESLNSIKSEAQNFETPYHQLLQHREEGRAQARTAWGKIENIKELKDGYLSQVVHRIQQLILKYNAIVMLEDLNFGFKRGRFKIEKQIYQKFEKALIHKLNYVVDKSTQADELGGVRKAYQLTAPFESFEKLGKQSGVLFYVPAWNTSKIDPVTGFVDLLKPKYENLDKAQAFFKTFASIIFNAKKDYFEFKVNLNQFAGLKAQAARAEWTICSYGPERHVYQKKNAQQGETVIVNVTEELKALFAKNNIEVAEGVELKEMICAQTQVDFFKRLIWLLQVLLALRYSSSKDKLDYILSPVANVLGEFFDSRHASTHLPQDSDANGAYHIALKGLWVIEQLKTAANTEKVNLAISNDEWLRFAQEKLYLT
ncbi:MULTISPECIES: type V CRISPR-associated protein Cas12a/Cpf1 [unclassified Acinetobacter]|uniref:type V CRISPR-associated protein Cas12a/Cpf1 n=1 Tax=unclassified Acinetobacter TaxID=196816 RepID=UPI0015D45CBA|nr:MULTISPECIES: type V CRISPR-associated protein Cas12a/Cpf1 [unclassified Acinetobacter]